MNTKFYWNMRRDYALRKPDLVSLLRFSVARSIINFVMEHGFRKNHNFFFGNNTLLWCCYSVFLSLSYLSIYWTWRGPRGIFYKALTISIFFSISSFISNHFVIYIEFCVSSPFTCITIHLHNQNLLTISWHLALETHYQQEQICTGGVNTLFRRDINM